MSAKKAHLELIRLRDLALTEALYAPIEDLRKVDAERGVDSDQEASNLRHSLRELTAHIVRDARAPTVQRQQIVMKRERPSFERLKVLVQDVFTREPELKLAFREGKKQSEQDWTSLYDDLVDIGAINPDEN